MVAPQWEWILTVSSPSSLYDMMCGLAWFWFRLVTCVCVDWLVAGKDFPWIPKPCNELNGMSVQDINDVAAAILFTPVRCTALHCKLLLRCCCWLGAECEHLCAVCIDTIERRFESANRRYRRS